MITIALRPQLARSNTATVARSSTFSGSCHRGERRGLVAAEDQEQLVIRRLLVQLLERVGRVRRALAVHLHPRRLEALVVPHRQLHHLEPRLRARVVLDLAMRRLAHGHEHDPVELELHQRLLRAHEVADVRRVECSSEDAYAQTGYSRTCPEPSTTNL